MRPDIRRLWGVAVGKWIARLVCFAMSGVLSLTLYTQERGVELAEEVWSCLYPRMDGMTLPEPPDVDGSIAAAGAGTLLPGVETFPFVTSSDSGVGE